MKQNLFRISVRFNLNNPEHIEKVSDKNSEDASGVGDDAGAFVIAGEPSGNYQPDAGNASVSMSDAGSTTGVTFDMAG